MKVALCFWGLTRSLKYTIDSIQSNLLNILKKESVNYTIFMHTYTINRPYTNTWAKEYNILLDNEEYKLLSPDYLEIDNQDVIRDMLNLPEYRKMPDYYKNNYETIDNFILAMYSKLQLTLLITKSDIEFDYYIYLRPDTMIKDVFNLTFFECINDTTLAIPKFELCYNFNDKFAITNRNTYIIYGSIFNILLESSKICILHPETLYFNYIKSYNIMLVYIPIILIRIRANGKEYITNISK